MTLRNLVPTFWFGVIAAVLMAGPALAVQKQSALSLDVRPGEDPLLIDVTEITRQYPRAAVQEYEKAVADAGRGKIVAAVMHFEEAIRIAPEFFNAHNSLGILYQRMERHLDAERQYRESHRLNPRSAAPLVNLGGLYLEKSMSRAAGDLFARRRMLHDALGSLNAALEIQPSSASAHCLLGVVYYMTGSQEDAEFHLKRALDNGSGLRLARLALAGIYMDMQDWKNGVLQLDTYLAENRFASDRHWIRIVRDEMAEKLKEGSQ